MAKKLTMQQKSERGRSERRQIGQKQRKDRKEEAAIARANAMLDEMMRDGTITDIQKSKARNNEKDRRIPNGGK
jgi:membrane peptidoglycan carboxypeptidase